MGWLDPIIAVPRITFKKLEELVEEVYFLETDEELDGRSRKELAEKLAQRVLNEYVVEYFGESTKVAAQMFRNRSQGRTTSLPL